MSPSLHPTACIHPGARIHDSGVVGPYAVIDEHVEVGANCHIGPHVYLTGYTRIGEGNQIHAGTVVGDLPQDLSFKTCVSHVEIGNRNVIREHVTIHRGTAPDSKTIIGDDNFLMANCHVAHNCVLGNKVIMANGSLLAGHVQIYNNVFLSGNTVVHQFTRIGSFALVRGLGAVGKDIPPYCIAAGVNRVMGINTIGLRRAGFKTEQRQIIKKAFKLLYRSGLNMSQAISQIEALPRTPEISILLDFLKSSKRGICPARWDVRATDFDE